MLLLFPSSTQARRRQGPRGRYDVPLLLAAIALASFGVVMVASSSIAVAAGQHLGPFYYLQRHLVFLGMGIALAVFAARLELRFVEKHHLLWMLVGIVLLLAVFLPFFGMRINGARRWINLVVTSFQPVEAVKLIVIVYLASYLVRHRDGVERKLFGVIKPVGVALFIAALLLAQPDFGSAALVIAVTVGMIWLGGARMRNLLLLGAPLVPIAAWIALSQDYRIKRLTSFLDPWKDPFNDGFQLTQALIAIGRGEWTGVGLGASVQKLFYLPEAHTDFILAVIGEELGLLGILAVLVLFGILVGRGLLIGLKGVELGQRFAGYVAFGISLMIGLQALVSIGVNLGVLPTKGLTLPLISSGGSSVLMTCAMIGVLLRATYEINRAEDARRMAVRANGAVAEVDA
ncbi:MAG TPA: putative lipid II flippase FtsW [Rhodanobacteraceae bacterium]|nr:putative lipid II flippase FtsW [Rhodanobacteraceae bacterium]